MGGAGRAEALAAGGAATRVRARKGPAGVGRRGLSDYLQSRMAYSVIFLVCRIPRIWVK